MGRELCLFVAVDSSRVPQKERAAFVALAVRQAAPYADPAYDSNWIGDQAAVWYWSRGRVIERLGQTPPQRSRFVAEACHIGGIAEDAAELLALSVGYEGRLWKRRRIMASRWWPQAPTASEWSAFLRGAGVPAASPAPPPVPVVVAERAWGDSARGARSARAGLSDLQAHLPRIVVGISLAAALLFSWQIGTTARALLDARQAERAARDLDDALTRILAARTSAEEARSEINALLQLRQGVPQHRLMGEVARLTSDAGAQVTLWQQPHPERLEVTLTMASPDPEALVTAWEASPLFGDVTVELARRQGEIVVRASVEGGAP